MFKTFSLCYNKFKGDSVKKIMIVEDDNVICLELKQLLSNNGYDVVILEDFKDACHNVLKEEADLVLLDINIPYLNGELLLKNLREKSNVPVIMVTSCDNELDEALSIMNGADDYITKPYNLNILLLRIKAVLRRSEKISNVINYKDLKINLSKGIIQKEEMTVILTKNEMIIFSFLLNNRNRIVTRDEIMTDLWDNDEFINDNALTVNISRLRTKLKSLGYENIITTKKGYGYILL